MARIVITVEDSLIDGTVKVVADPSFTQIAEMVISGNQTTAAHGMALTMMNSAIKASKENRQKEIRSRFT